MKTYKVSGLYRWSRFGAKVVLTGVAGVLYFLAVTEPTPFVLRLALLAGIALFGWLFYVRLPKVPTQITISDDGLVNFKSRRGTTSIAAADIRSIDRTFGRALFVSPTPVARSECPTASESWSTCSSP